MDPKRTRRTLTVEVTEGKPITEAELQAWVERFARLLLDTYRSQHERKEA